MASSAPSTDNISSRKSRLAVPSGADSFLSPKGGVITSTSRTSAQYFARLADIRQMDVQSALDQMRSLLSGRPHTVYKTAYYRKQTKNHWARDDPAFVGLQGAFLLVASIAYSVAFRVPLTGALSFIVHSILWNWLVSGMIVASVLREIANRHLMVVQSSSHVKQSVEWLYAFDIHCNAFFPLFGLLCTQNVRTILKDGVQFFLLPLVLGNSLMALILANTLYAAALSWYWYITHLGYRSLPFLSNTEVFLFPIAGIVLIYILNLVGYPFGMGWNAARIMAHIYFD